MRRVEFELGLAAVQAATAAAASSASPTCRPIPASRNERCEEVYNIQVRGPGDAAAGDRHREGRDRRVGRPRLDPRADRRPRARSTAWGCPARTCSATRCPASPPAPCTLRNAHALMDALGRQRRRDRHPPVGARRCCATSAIRPPTARPQYDVTYENVQAGERTSHLFRLANYHRRAGARHRRPLRAGAGLEHLRRRRSDVALQRQRLGAQDADPVPAPLGDRHRPVRRRGQRGARSRSSTPRSPPS